MIRGYFGLPGSGKTYSMVRDIQYEGRGKRIYSNFKIDVPNAKEIILLDKPIDLKKCHDGIVLLDEAGLWLPSFIWKKIPEDLIWKLAQVRKAGLDLWYTAQNPARVVKVLRELTYESVYMEKWFMFFVARVRSEIQGNLISWRVLPFSKAIAERYDTMELIEVIK